MTSTSGKRSLVELGAIPAGELPPMVSLVGPEEFLRREARQQLLERQHGGPVPAEDLTRLSGDRQVTPDLLVALFDELRTPSLFGGRRSVLVEHAEGYLSVDPDAWLRFLTSGWEGALLVLELDALDGRTKLAKALQRHGWVLEATRPFHRPPPWKPQAAPWDNPLNGWLRARAQSLWQLEIDPPTAHLLQTRVGTSLADLAHALERLRTALGSDGRVISRELVEQHTHAGEESDLFELVDVVLSGERARGLTLAREFLHRGAVDPQGGRVTDGPGLLLQFSGALLRRLRQLRQVHQVLAQGGGEAEILQAAGVARPLLPRIRLQARATPPPRVARLFAELRRSDRELKSGGGALPGELLERLVLC